MNRVNEFDIEPGPYQFRGEIIVVVDVLTHGESAPLPEPLVIWRPMVAPVEHVEGKPVTRHRRHSMQVHVFKELIQTGTIKQL